MSGPDALVGAAGIAGTCVLVALGATGWAVAFAVLTALWLLGKS